MSEPTFETKVLSGIDTLETKLKNAEAQRGEMLNDISRLSKESKQALEELTRVKNACNDADENLKALQKAQATLERERQHSFRTPMQQALGSEKFRNFINGFIRRLSNPNMKLPDHLERALTGVDSSMGQATIPTEYMSEVYSLLYDYGQFSSLRVMPVGARTDSFPIATARPSYYWIGAGTGGTAESSAITEGSKTGTSVSLSIQTLAALLHVTRELIQDSTVDISGMVTADLAQAVSYGLDFMTFAADATADQTDAGYYGIFESATVNTYCKAEAAAGNITVAKTDLEDWVRCLSTVTGSVLRRGAKWWLHPTLFSQAMLIRDNNGRPIFQTALEIPNPGAIGAILGYPVIPVNAAPSTNAASAKVAVFGDPEGYVVGLRQQIELATTDALKFAENMQSFRAIARAGGKHRIPASNPSGFVPFAVLTLPAA